jgi:hypothetical protein
MYEIMIELCCADVITEHTCFEVDFFFDFASLRKDLCLGMAVSFSVCSWGFDWPLKIDSEVSFAQSSVI